MSSRFAAAVDVADLDVVRPARDALERRAGSALAPARDLAQVAEACVGEDALSAPVPEPRLAWYDWVALGVNAYHQLLLGGDGTLEIAIALAKLSFDGAGTSVALRGRIAPCLRS